MSCICVNLPYLKCKMGFSSTPQIWGPLLAVRFVCGKVGNPPVPIWVLGFYPRGVSFPSVGAASLGLPAHLMVSV